MTTLAATHFDVSALVAQAAAEDSTSNPLIGLLPLLLVGAGFYFFLIRPQRRRLKGLQQMRSAMQVGDQVRTVGGILGTIVSLDDEEASLRVSSEIEMRFARFAVAEVINSGVNEPQ